MTLNRADLQAFLGRALYDVAAAHSALAIVLGARLGLYRALSDGGAATAGELASRTRTDSRYMREWLLNQAAGGYVTRDGERYSLSSTQREVLVDGGEVDVVAAMDLALAVAGAIDDVEKAFRTGGGVDYSTYGGRAFAAMDRFSASTYRAHLIEKWLPAMGDVVPRLAAGARVLDVGCGAGSALLLMAERFPQSSFVGIDKHAESIGAARRRSTATNATFRVEDGGAIEGEYDLITSFDVLHDVADPNAIAASVARALTPGGAWLIVEPRLAPNDDELMNPYGRFLTALSLAHCIPVSRADGGEGYGMSMRPAALTAIVEGAGFATREIESPMSTVLDARRAA